MRRRIWSSDGLSGVALRKGLWEEQISGRGVRKSADGDALYACMRYQIWSLVMFHCVVYSNGFSSKISVLGFTWSFGVERIMSPVTFYGILVVGCKTETIESK